MHLNGNIFWNALEDRSPVLVGPQQCKVLGYRDDNQALLSKSLQSTKETYEDDVVLQKGQTEYDGKKEGRFLDPSGM